MKERVLLGVIPLIRNNLNHKKEELEQLEEHINKNDTNTTTIEDNNDNNQQKNNTFSLLSLTHNLFEKYMYFIFVLISFSLIFQFDQVYKYNQ